MRRYYVFVAFAAFALTCFASEPVESFQQFARVYRVAPSAMFYFTDPCPASVTSGVTTCYFIANGGSDTAAGTKAAPWAHLNGMPSCTTGHCTTHTPAASNGYIFKGGDTWGFSDMGVNWLDAWSGTSSNPIYIGVDSTWYSGASWTRPIFDCQLTANCGNNFGGGSTDLRAQIYINRLAHYVVIDNLEMKGIYVDSTTTYSTINIQTAGLGTEIKNLYIHGWGHAWHTDTPSHTDASYGEVDAITGNTGYDLTGVSAHDNVIDNSDETHSESSVPDMVVGITNIPHIYRNVVRYTRLGIGYSFNNAHDNLVEWQVENYWNPALGVYGTQPHCDMIYQHGPIGSVTNVFAYNNVLRHASLCVGIPVFWMMGSNGVSCPTCRIYVFNNVQYDVADGAGGFGLAGHPSDGCDMGVMYTAHNTASLGSSVLTGNGEAAVPADVCGGAKRGTVHSLNNHGVTSASSLYDSSGVNVVVDGGDLKQNAGEVAVHYANEAAAFAYAPLDVSAEGHVTPGISTASLYAAINAADSAAGAAFLKTTTYGVCLNSAAHAAVDCGLSVVARSVTPDIGAYQYSAGAAGSGTVKLGSNIKFASGTKAQ